MDRSQQLSPIWKPYAQAAQALGARLTQAALGPGRSGTRLDDLARRLHKEFEQMSQHAFAALPGGGLACAPGCDHCCRTLRVFVSPIEVFTIVRRLRQTHTTDPSAQERIAAAADEYARLVEKAANRATDRAGSEVRSDTPSEAGSRTGPQPPPTHRRLLPCPLLNDGLCLVYSSRPLACRGCASADASLCAACDESRPVPRSTAHQLGTIAMMSGVQSALDGLGLAGRAIELCSGLTLALREEDAEKRWLRGKDVFPAPDGHVPE